MLSAVVGRGLPLWGLSASWVLLGLSGAVGAVLFCVVSAFEVSSTVGTVRGGLLSAAFRWAGWWSGAGWSLGVAFCRAEACGFAGVEGIVTLISMILIYSSFHAVVIVVGIN